ncbi:MAG: response regulator [Verrucomicrobiota bacterium]|jgi:CheY-like chemotaxis protein
MTALLAKNLNRMHAAFEAQTVGIAAVTPLPSAHTVLVIDDDAVLLELMYLVLSAAGFNVLTTTRGTKGLEMLQQLGDVVKVVLLDYQAPVINGAQMLAGIRCLAPAAKVLGVSGCDPYNLQADFREGVDGLLEKPFTRCALIEAVWALLPAGGPALNREHTLAPRQQPVHLPVALSRLQNIERDIA